MLDCGNSCRCALGELVISRQVHVAYEKTGHALQREVVPFSFSSLGAMFVSRRRRHDVFLDDGDF